MNRRSVALLVLWLVPVVGGILGGWTRPNTSLATTFPTNEIGWALVAGPLIASIALAFLPAKYHSMSWPTIQRVVDRVFGHATYQKAFVELGIVPWVGLAALLDGIIGAGRSLMLGTPNGAFYHSLFFLSSGVGALLFYFIIRARGERAA
jgi:hypothetical protein